MQRVQEPPAGTQIGLLDKHGQPLQVGSDLALFRCPHCSIADPMLANIGGELITEGRGGRRQWSLFACRTCGGAVMAATRHGSTLVIECYPWVEELHATVPQRPREYLRQATESLSQPVASIAVSAAAVDAMLKEKGLSQGSLKDRIDQAAASHLITDGIKQWAHQLRLDASDQRYAAHPVALPTQEDARRCLDFAIALADFLYVLPAKVTRGIQQSAPQPQLISQL